CSGLCSTYVVIFYFCDATVTSDLYPLSLHDALPISTVGIVASRRLRQERVIVVVDVEVAHESGDVVDRRLGLAGLCDRRAAKSRDRKSTRLNSSHRTISYAVFCLKKKR